MTQAERKDVWASGDAYEPYLGRWSRLVANEFLQWLSVPADCDWLDVGCGTGALTQTILKEADPSRALGVDPSAGLDRLRASLRRVDRASRVERLGCGSVPHPSI